MNEGTREFRGGELPRTALKNISMICTELVGRGKDGRKLKKVVVVVVRMMKACLGVSGIPGPDKSWQLGREEEHWRWLLGRQGSQCSRSWCYHDPINKVPQARRG